MGIFTVGSNPKIELLTLGATDEEVSYTFPKNTRAFTVTNQSNNAFKYSWATGEIAAGTYINVADNGSIAKDLIHFSSNLKKIYFMAGTQDDILAIETWT